MCVVDFFPADAPLVTAYTTGTESDRTVTSFVFSGTATDCKKVTVTISTANWSSSADFDVMNGGWQALFANGDASWHCGDPVNLYVECKDNKQCNHRARVVAECQPLSPEPGPAVCPNIDWKLSPTWGDCDASGRRSVSAAAHVLVAGGTSVSADLSIWSAAGNTSSSQGGIPAGILLDRQSNQASDFDLQGSTSLLPGDYQVTVSINGPSGCGGSSLQFQVPECDSGTSQPGSGGTQSGMPPRRPWYCVSLELIWMIALFLALVLMIVALCALVEGAQLLTTPAAAIFWFILGATTTIVELLVNIVLTLLSIFFVALILWIRLCHPSKCRVLGDLCWVVFWSATFSAPVAAGFYCWPGGLYAFFLGWIFAILWDYTQSQGCDLPRLVSLPFLQ